MLEIKEALQASGCKKDHITVIMDVVTQIIDNGRVEFYRQANELYKAQDELAELKAKLSGLASFVGEKPAKRPYVRKGKADVGRAIPGNGDTLLDKSGVTEASSKMRQKETDAEIKAAVEGLGSPAPKAKKSFKKQTPVIPIEEQIKDGIVLTPEEEKANHKIEFPEPDAIDL